MTSFNGTAEEATQFCDSKNEGNVIVAETAAENVFLAYLVRFHKSSWFFDEDWVDG